MSDTLFTSISTCTVLSKQGSPNFLFDKFVMPLPLSLSVEEIFAFVSLLDDVLYGTPPITTTLFNFYKQAVLGFKD